MITRMRRGTVLLSLVVTVLAGSAIGASANRPPDEGTVVATSAGSTALTSGWAIQSSAGATGTGGEISDPAFPAPGWLPIPRPETLMAALVENGRYPNIFFSNNLASVAADQFAVNWWYRKQLHLHPSNGGHTVLVMNRVLSRAEPWGNRTQGAHPTQVQGASPRVEDGINRPVPHGANAIALHR